MTSTRARRDRGAVIPLFALLLPVLILMMAFAIDLGHQRADRRTMQARADAIALDMVRQTGSLAWPAINSDATVLAALAQSESRNGIAPSKVQIAWGTWDETNGFRICNSTVTGCNAIDSQPTAVQVSAATDTKYFFQPGQGHVVRSAVAATDASACYTVGTSLASIDSSQSSLLDLILGRILHGGVALSGVSYSGLLGVGLNLGQLATQLGFASPDELVNANVNARTFYLATAQVLQNQGSTAAATALQALALQTTSNLVIPVGNVLQVEQGGSQAALGAGVDLYSLVTGSVFAINGTNTISIPNLGVAIPNVAGLALELDVTQRPQLKCGRKGSHLTTQQVRLKLTPTISSNISVAGLLGTSISGSIPLTASVAGGTGTLTGVNCAAPSISVGLAPQPISVSELLNLSISAKVLGLPVPVAKVDSVGVTVQTNGTSNGATLHYTNQFLPPTGTGTFVKSPSTSIGLAGASNLSSGQVTVLGIIPVPVPGLLTAVNALLSPILTVLDNLVVNTLSDLLGLNLGGADIGGNSMTCKGVKLVG